VNEKGERENEGVEHGLVIEQWRWTKCSRSLRRICSIFINPFSMTLILSKNFMKFVSSLHFGRVAVYAIIMKSLLSL